MTNRKPMYFDTLKKDTLYLLTPKLGNPTGDKTLLSPMYFPRNILEEAITSTDKKFPLKDVYGTAISVPRAYEIKNLSKETIEQNPYYAVLQEASDKLLASLEDEPA